jgi:diguanylate cyclase (GGDEF)-like protein/PAS domain S-box-containing protein
MAAPKRPKLSEDNLQLLVVDHMLELAYATDLSGTVQTVLPSVTTLLGYKPEEFIAHFNDILVAGSDLNEQAKKTRRRFLEDVGNSGDSHAPIYHHEFLHKNGNKAVFEIHEMILSENGAPVGRLCVGLDVTEHLREVAELQDSNQGLMVVHHTQNMLMNASGRRDLLQIALDVPMSMMAFPRGALFDLENAESPRMEVRGLSQTARDAIASFSLTQSGEQELLEHEDRNTAMLLSPGHSWLAPLEPTMGGELSGLLIICKGKPQALVALACDQNLSREERRLLQSIGNLVAHALEDVILPKTLDRMSFTDASTGLYSRNYTDDYLKREERLIRRHGRTASVVLISLVPEKPDDEPEKIDQAIVAIARAFRDRVRTTDLLARYGNAEFLLYLPETDRTGAMTMVDRCVHLFDDLLKENGMQDRILLAVGVATTENGHRALQEILDEARRSVDRSVVDKKG